MNFKKPSLMFFYRAREATEIRYPTPLFRARCARLPFGRRPSSLRPAYGRLTQKCLDKSR